MSSDSDRCAVLARLYVGLARVLDDPSAELVTLSEENPWLAALGLAAEAGVPHSADCFDRAWELVSSMAADVAGAAEALQLEHTRLFFGLPRPLVSPYEHAYGGATGALPMLQATTAHLRRARLAVAEDFHDLPDHICVQLELMAALLAQSPCAAANFVESRLHEFAHGFARALRSRTTSGFYRVAADALEHAVDLDLAEDWVAPDLAEFSS